MFDSRFRAQLIGMGFVYATVIALVLYAAFHEGLGVTLTVWNCIPPTLGLIAVISALGKSTRRLIASATFAVLAAGVTAFFFGRWFFTPLDTDPHSSTTALVFVFAPLWSLAVALVGLGLAWLVARKRTAP